MKALYLLILTMIFCLSFQQNLEAQSTYNKIQDQGMTSQTHRSNVGKILWADHRIKFNIQDNTQYADEFESTSALYGRGYLEHCLYNFSIDLGNDNCLNPSSQFELRVRINDGEAVVFHRGSFPDQNWTTFQINLALSSGDSEDNINQGVTTKWAAFANKLGKGKHKITIEFWGGKEGCEKKKYSEGSFTYVKSTDTKLKGSGPEVPPAAMNDPKLEKEMLEQVRNQGWKNDTPIDVVIIESDWRIIRDGWGNITDREINTFIIVKNINGECSATDMSFRQPYTGKGYGKTQFYGLGMKKIPVTCSDYSK